MLKQLKIILISVIMLSADYAFVAASEYQNNSDTTFQLVRKRRGFRGKRVLSRIRRNRRNILSKAKKGKGRARSSSKRITRRVGNQKISNSVKVNRFRRKHTKFKIKTAANLKRRKLLVIDNSFSLKGQNSTRNLSKESRRVHNLRKAKIENITASAALN